MKPCLGLRWRICHILASEDIDDFSDITFDPLTVYLIFLVYDPNIFGSSSEVFIYLQKSFVISRNSLVFNKFMKIVEIDLELYMMC